MRTKDEQTKKSYRLDGKITTELQTFTYDHADRLITQTHKLDSHPQITLTENSYDNLCRLSSKRVMGEQISYDYNIRNWLTAITSPHYSQAMTYNLYGNMNAMQWRHDSATTPQGYNFSYDGLSRLKQTVFTGGEMQDEFSTHYAYDLNGNITELYRNATDIDGYLAVMDEITMNYNGNQLTQADNSSDEDTAYEGVRYHGGNLLTYDENGCLTADLDKNISSIQYNSLNLPTYMRLSTASASIRYQYDSKGNKLQETRISRRPKMRHETSYCGNFVFENKVLKRILVDGGFIYFGENDTTYHYFLKDHLGSNRAVVNAKTGQVVEKYDYYPFGKQHGDYHTGYIHPYRYNGKELESMMGIDWLYYGARMMEPEWGRFTTPDPLAEKYYHISPYAYANNNPIRFIDPNGKETHVAMNGNGTYRIIGGELNNNRNIYVYSQDKNGNYTIRGESIGITSSTTSFYNSDANNGKGSWSINSIIDPNDNSGRDFLKNIISKKITLDNYMDKARTDHPYDFKVTNGSSNVVSKSPQYVYRGMSIGKTMSGQAIYTSARDIGNIAAGVVAAKNGIPWNVARMAFDIYQGGREGISTQRAEYYGWSQTYARSNGISEGGHLNSTFKSIINKVWTNIRNIW